MLPCYTRRSFMIIYYAVLLLIDNHHHVTEAFAVDRADHSNDFGSDVPQYNHVESTTTERDIKSDETTETNAVTEPVNSSSKEINREGEAIDTTVNSVYNSTVDVTTVTSTGMEMGNGTSSYPSATVTSVPGNTVIADTVQAAEDTMDGEDAGSISKRSTYSYGTTDPTMTFTGSERADTATDTKGETVTESNVMVIGKNKKIIDTTTTGGLHTTESNGNEESSPAEKQSTNDAFGPIDPREDNFKKFNHIFHTTRRYESFSSGNNIFSSEARPEAVAKNDVYSDGNVAEADVQLIEETMREQQSRDNFITDAEVDNGEESSLSVRPVTAKGSALYTVNANYKRLKKIDIVPAKPFTRDPNDNSWRNESISSLGIVFKANNASKPLSLVLKNKTEAELNAILEKLDKDDTDAPELRERLEKLSEMRKSKKKRPDHGEDGREGEGTTGGSVGDTGGTWGERTTGESVGDTGGTWGERTTGESVGDTGGTWGERTTGESVGDTGGTWGERTTGESVGDTGGTWGERTTGVSVGDTGGTWGERTTGESVGDTGGTWGERTTGESVGDTGGTWGERTTGVSVGDTGGTGEEGQPTATDSTTSGVDLLKMDHETISTTTTTETPKQMLNFFENFATMFDEEKFLSSVTTDRKSTASPAPTLAPDRKPTLQYFPPLETPKPNGRLDNTLYIITTKAASGNGFPISLPPLEPDPEYRYVYDRGPPNATPASRPSPTATPATRAPPTAIPAPRPASVPRPPPHYAVPRGYYTIFTDDRDLNRGSYVVKHFKDFIDRAIEASDHERSPEGDTFIPTYTIGRAPRQRVRDHRTYGKGGRIGANRAVPVLYNTSVVHGGPGGGHGGPGGGRGGPASSSAYVRRLDEPGGESAEKPCDPHCDGVTVELSPEYELHYYVPEQEEREMLQEKPPNLQYDDIDSLMFYSRDVL